MKRIIQIFSLLVGVVLVFYTFYYIYKQSQPKADVYALEIPTLRDITHSCVVSGKIEPGEEIFLKPKITGTISELYVAAGEKVHKGQILARLKVIPDMEKLEEAKSQIEIARIALEEEEKRFRRSQTLFEKKALTLEAYENATASLQQAKEKYQTANNYYNVVTQGTSPRGGDINTTLIQSPIEGIVLDVPFKEGTSVSATSLFSPGTTIFRVADMNSLIFKGYIDETEIANLKNGMSVILYPGAIRDLQIPAVLEYISPFGEERNGTMQFEIKAKISSVPFEITLRSGYSVNARIDIESHQNVLSVLESCIHFEKDKTPFVYRLVSDKKNFKRQKWEKVPIEIGLSDGTYVEIVSGISQEDLIQSQKIEQKN